MVRVLAALHIALQTAGLGAFRDYDKRVTLFLPLHKFQRDLPAIDAPSAHKHVSSTTTNPAGDRGM